MTKKVVVLPGDGIGAEVTREAVLTMKAVGEQYGITFETEEYQVGGSGIDSYGKPINAEILDACKEADAVLLGAVGGPKWDNVPEKNRPEVALLSLRKELELFTNLRPVKVYDALSDASSLKKEVVSGINILVVRELTGGIYFGEPRTTEKTTNGLRAVDTMAYTSAEVERIAEVAFRAAENRRQKVTSVDKANILATSRLWRKTVNETAQDFSGITLEHMLVDNCAMQLVRNPKQFDVILTENMFGDILSDEAAMLTGSIGMLPSASLGNGTAMYEPVHGSAPDIAGQDKANPLAAIASVAMMFRFSLENEDAARAIEESIEETLNAGYRTSDLYTEGFQQVGTSAMGEQIRTNIQQKNEETPRRMTDV